MDAHSSPARLLAVGAVAVLLALAGCGGGGDGGSGGSDEGAEATKAYRAAKDICSAGLENVASTYGMAPNREEVVQLVAELVVTSRTPAEEAQARRGCEEGLDEAEGGGEEDG